VTNSVKTHKNSAVRCSLYTKHLFGSTSSRHGQQ